jgi:hypothetical protein
MLKAFVKLHKPHNPIRPVVSYRQAPAYKLAEFIAKFLKDLLALPNSFNIKNVITLMEDLKQVNVESNLRICSFDIDNMLI